MGRQAHRTKSWWPFGGQGEIDPTVDRSSPAGAGKESSPPEFR